MREEGVIKFDLEFTPAPPVSVPGLEELNAWRHILRQLGLIGQDPARYGGCGFGNVSRRLPPYDARRNQRAFIVSGSQTGHLQELSSAGFATVSQYDVPRSRIVGSGPVKPSSESLTHASIYNTNNAIRVIFHVHSPAIWRAASKLNLAATAAEVSYGTLAMAHEVERLIETAGQVESGVFVMGGHEDGVIAFGQTADGAGCALIRTLAQSLACKETTCWLGPLA